MRASRILPVVAIMATIVLSGCSRTDDAEDGGIPSADFQPLFQPTAGTVPFPFDGLFAGFVDPTLNIPNAQNAPFVNAANELDGYSTTAPIFADFIGFADIDEIPPNGLFIIDTVAAATNPAAALLVRGVDFELSNSPAIDPNTNRPIENIRTRVQIKPLRPLNPGTRYVVIFTNAWADRDGGPLTRSRQFRIAASTTPVAEQDPAEIQGFTPQQLGTLEALRSQVIRPTLTGVAPLLPLVGLEEDDISLIWPFTTQSLNKTLPLLVADATPQTLNAIDIGMTANQLLPALGDNGTIADMYVGGISLPYYLHDTTDGPQAPLQGFWEADPTQPDLAAPPFLGQVPCGAFAAGATLPGSEQPLRPSASTTSCFPVPVQQSDQTVPLLISKPNITAAPAAGWPVVIFQHGITGNRSQVLPLVPALTMAGFVVVSMDLPLHGAVPVDAEDSLNQLRAANALVGASERTFELDLTDNATGAPGPDGNEDPSGTHFINLASLLTSRDNLRQAVLDLTHLKTSLANLDLGGDSIDTSRIHFIGHSLGGIVGTAFLALNDDVQASTLAMAGGGIAKLLDGSKSFGPRITAGLAASGVPEGSENFETFLRFAQQIIDDADPLNYASTLVANGTPLHFIEVVDDLVVPNTVPRTPADDPVRDRVVVSGPLSGSTPLWNVLDLEFVSIPEFPAEVDIRLGPTAPAAVQFGAGDHGSILSPAASPAATQEMQRQIASFLGSNGMCLPIGGSCD